MICPSCSEQSADSAKHCIRCGIALTRRSLQMAKVLQNFAWVARRALGGFFAGAVGCLLSIAVGRVIALGGSGGEPPTFAQLLDFFPGKTPFSTAVAACFLGTVGGMIERSAYKAFLGGLLGAAGGALGGLAMPFFDKVSHGYLYAYSLSVAAAWAAAGGMIGLTSGLLEGTRSKVLVGILGGLAGGGIGGGIGSQMYGAMLMDAGKDWALQRGIEALAGGVVGVHLWFFLGLAEKIYIFQRRPIAASQNKVCDSCHADNPLNAWYCLECGAALQVAATREQMRVTPFRGLERVANALQFLSWLAAITGVILGAVLFLSFAMQNFLFAFFGSMLVGLAAYIVAVAFKALAEGVRIAMQSAEKGAR